MTRDRSPLLILLALALVPLTSGCASMPISRLRTEKLAAGLVARPRPPAAVARSTASVHLIVPGAFGCVTHMPPFAGRVIYGCFDLAPGSDGDLESKVKAASAQVPKPLSAFYFPDYGPSLATMLRYHLGLRFAAATVALAGTDPRPGFAVRPQIDITAGGGHQTMAVSLSVPLASGTTLVGVGGCAVETGNGHLGWAIPLLILFFPSSLFWIPPIIGAIVRGYQEEALTAATDQAARDLSDKLVAAHATAAAPPATPPPGAPPPPGPGMPPPATPAAPTACTKDTDCAGSSVCSAGRCTAPTPAAPTACTKDTDCAGNSICTQGACVSPR